MPAPPRIDDGQMPYFYLPYGASLYGRAAAVHRWIRVTDSEESVVHTISTRNEVTDVVYSYGLKTYLSYLTFGYTPFVEVAMSGLRTGVDVRSSARLLLTQACHRSYESRIRFLMGIAEKKRKSVLTRNNPVSYELSDEIAGCLIIWEQLMNSGMIQPNGCLLSAKLPHGSPLGMRRMNWITRKYTALSSRNLTQNTVHLPYKMDEASRTLFLASYGVTL